jgi:hypothetical protein
MFSRMSARAAIKAFRTKPSHRAPIAEVGLITAATNDYRRLCIWRRQHVPWLLLAGGTAIFFRLMTAPVAQPLRVRDLNIDAGVSASEVRVVLDELHRKGLASISRDPKDGSEHVEATDLLRRLAGCYVQTMDQLL